MIAHDPFPLSDWAERHGVRYADFETVLRSSDILSLHLPLLPETTHLLNERTLAQTRRGVFIVNTSRGKLIDTDRSDRGAEIRASRRCGSRCL